MEQLTYCILTGFKFNNNVKFISTQENTIKYKFTPIGIVHISKHALVQIQSEPLTDPWILAGICRYAYINNTEPPTITTDLLNIYKARLEYPKKFKEKVHILLKYIYDSGGADFKPINLGSYPDYPLAFASDPDEFVRIMDYAEDQDFLRYSNKQALAGGLKMYYDILLSNSGIAEVEKKLPNIPMVSLVNQEIRTGNPQIDMNINHAKKLFFKTDSTLAEKRSACETLSFVLEPLRDDLNSFFSISDINDFFQIVNKFDIRHNKNTTTKLVYEEQLEWIFYTLLNTINTYTKLKAKIN